jgi:putative ABC transport system permease protein
MLPVLAWRNIWRNKKRSLIVVMAIAFGLWGGLLSGAVMMGMSESMVRSAIDRNLAHIQIHTPTFQREKEIRDFIPSDLQVVRNAERMNGVQAVSPRALIYGMASSPASAYSIKIVGIDPAREKRVTTLWQDLIQGRFFSNEGRNPILIGEKLANRLKLKLRNKVVLSFEGMDGAITYMACRITGIFKTESSQFDESNVYVQSADLYRVLGSDEIVHEIALRASSTDVLDKLSRQLQLEYPELRVETWRELAPELAFMAATMENFTYLFVAIILLALVFGIANTMLMSVMERIRELGVLMAVGLKKGKIFLLILLETFALSLVGGMAGTAFSALSISFLGRRGIDLSAFAASMESFGAGSVLFPFLPPAMYLYLILMIMAAANMAALMPAWKAIHLEPAEAIRAY